MLPGPPEPGEPSGGPSGLATLVDIKVAKPQDALQHPSPSTTGVNSASTTHDSPIIKSRKPPSKANTRWKKVFSIRSLVILVSVLQVVGAIAVSWSITYALGVHNIETLAGSLIQGIHQQTRKGVTNRMEQAYFVVMQSKNEFESGMLTKDGWRRMLEKFRRDLVLHTTLDTSYVRFLDSTFYGIERCDNATSNCPTGLRAAVNNGTVLNLYSADNRGQPLEWQAGVIFADSPTGWYRSTLNSPNNATWSRVRSSASPVTEPLANLVISYSAVIRPPQDIDERGGPVLMGFPDHLQRPAPEGWRPASASDPLPPVAGAVGANLPVGTLSSILREAVPVPEAIVVITTADGKMVASSTMRAEHILDVAKRSPIDASANPNPIIRQMVAADAATGDGGGKTISFRNGNREYIGGQGEIQLPPDLRWTIHVAVPKDVLLQEIQSSIMWTFIANVLWLVVCLVLAVVLSWRIAKPLLELRRSIARLVATMTNVTGELRKQAHGDEGAGLALPEGAAESLTPLSPKDPRGKPGGLWMPWRSARRRVLPNSGVNSGAGTPGWRGEGPLQSRAKRQSVALSSGLAELSAFQSLMSDVHSKFQSFQELSLTETALLKTLLAERKTKLEIEVREEETRKFLATMSHEMRTPLNGILGMLDLARECELSPAAAEYVSAAALSGEHLLALVNDVLDLQKIEAGAIALQSVAMDPRLAVMNAVRIVQQRAGDKAIKLSVSIDERVPPLVEGDPDRLRQVLLNLLSNAVKYTPQGGSVRIAAYLREGAAPEGHVAVQFDVADTGPGIDETSQQQLFTRFFRVHQAPEADPGGTGLGLAISREIVERAGGQIGCLSTPGIGSKFWFFLPLRRLDDETLEGAGSMGPVDEAVGSGVMILPAAALRSRSPRLSLNSRHGSPSRLSPAHSARPAPLARICSVLVAEDNAVNAKVLETMLKREGYTVQVASDGAEAVARFEAACESAGPAARAFDVVFMDCRMPGVDGYEATRRLRALEAARGLPRHFIVALTASVSSEDEAACLAAGMDAYMTKPIRKPVLLAKLAEALGQEPALGSPRRNSAGAGAGVAVHPHGAGVAAERSVPGTPRRKAAGSSKEHSPRSSPAVTPLPATENREPEAGGAGGAGGLASVAMGPGLLHTLSATSVAASGSGSGSGSGPGSGSGVSSLLLGAGSASPKPGGGAPRSLGASRRGSVASVTSIAPLDVLVVDDVEMNRRVLSAFLASDGHRVATASDGEEAAMLFEARARARAADPEQPRGPVFDFIFMDVQMPKLDGHGATRRIRAFEAAMALPARTTIIACTAFSTSHDRDGVIRSGMDDYLTKPVSRSVILSTITKWASGRGRPPAISSESSLGPAAPASAPMTRSGSVSMAVAPPGAADSPTPVAVAATLPWQGAGL
eukprot:tig00020610_g11951.t1